MDISTALTTDGAATESAPIAAPRRRKASNRDNSSTTILVVDERALVAEGIKSLLKQLPLNSKVLYASNAAAALDLLDRTSVDFVLLHLSFPDDRGIDILRQLNQSDDAPPVIVLSTPESGRAVRDAINAGAHGYIVETAPQDIILQAMTLAVTGQRLVLLPLDSMAESGCWVDGPHSTSFNRNDVSDHHARLTDQEKKILGHIKEAMSNKEIARELGILEGTVKVHVKSILRKLSAKNRTMAALMAARIEHAA